MKKKIVFEESYNKNTNKKLVNHYAPDGRITHARTYL